MKAAEACLQENVSSRFRPNDSEDHALEHGGLEAHHAVASNWSLTSQSIERSKRLLETKYIRMSLVCMLDDVNFRLQP
jgi:hypothetical protein